jgi:acetyl esterase/lipase
MSVGYLVGVILAAAGTLLALLPVRPPRALRSASYSVSIAFSELPLLFMAMLLVTTVLTVAGGDIDSPAGWAAVGGAVVTMLGQATLARRGVRARPAVEHALDDALGADWRSSIDPALAGRLRRRLPLARILLLPWPWVARPRSVERIANVRYGDAGRRNLLDVYRHRSRPAGAPTLVYLHGGGFFSGRKERDARPLLHRLANQGWVCISANYRLRPAATFPDHLIDAKKAIAWARDQGREYGADPTTVFVGGSSAGGHMAAMAALTPNDPAFQPGFESADTSIAAAICLFGYFGNYYGHGAASSPRSYIRADAPPFFVAQGDHDTYSPQFVDIARGFAGELGATSSRPVVYAELPGGQHSFDLFHSIRFETVVDGIEAFAAWVRSRPGDEG